MATVYDCIQANKGTFAVLLDCNSILKHFKFNDDTAFLKKAIEKSILESMATYVVNELLQCNESVIDEFIQVLRKIGQEDLIGYFYIAHPDSACKIFYEYTYIKPCIDEIPRKARRKLELNYRLILQYFKSPYQSIQPLLCLLKKSKAISLHTYNKLMYLCSKTGEVFPLLHIIINGNKYQYETFKKGISQYHPDVLCYI